MKLDPGKTALLTLDFQKGSFGFATNAEAIVPNATKVVEFARKKQFQIIHVGLGFSEGRPEISDTQSIFRRVKENNPLVIKDACFDADEEIHRVLTEKIFPGQATVLTADAFISGHEE